ncbi:uncharacterized protein LOC120072275 [Benincasa hispida]|uniref:uncharacterized protein LOC120072275 n=1 Tax=Benincasa hispida TaxID=102211 RepID=UPI001900A642|nr:uncharacterized protein LOC120072275 [Benincasa hispida]
MVDFFMTTDKQMEEPKSRKPRQRRNLQMEELPTFTKWLNSVGHSGSCNDANSKSKPVNGNRPVVRTPVVVFDSSEDGGAVVADVPKDRVQAVDDSISARAGCCCWQSSKSTRRECALKFHLSLRKRKVVTNGSEVEVVTVVSNLREEETVVAVSDVLEKDGCGCRCFPTFQICGRRKSIVVLQKEDGAVTDDPNLRTEEVANRGPDLVKEEEVVVVGGSDLRKEEGSGCCCGRCGCFPAFQICRRRNVVASKEEAVVDVPEVEEEVANDKVNKQEGDSVECLQAFQSHICCAGRKTVDDNPKTFEKEALASEDSSNVDVPDLQKEGSGGCCSCFKCMPTLHICGRRRNAVSEVPNPGREEKVVVSVSDPPEGEEVVAADEEWHSKSTQGGICWPFQICTRGWLPRFFLCGERITVDASNHREEEEKAPPDVQKEEVVAVIPDPQKESIAVADGIPDDGKEKQVAADDIPVQSTEEKMSAGKEENASSGSIQETFEPDLNQEDEGGCCRCFKLGGKEGSRRQHRRSPKSREGGWGFQICGWLPTLDMCRGRKKESVSIAKLHEKEGLVDNGVSEVHNEVVDAAGVTGVVADTDHSNSTRCCGCWHSKPRRRRAVDVVKDGGSGRCSKSKRRKGWLRRWGRKQREGKERKKKKFKIF